MLTSIIVIDDFYGEPYEVRKIATEMEYPAPVGEYNYPGRNSDKRLLVAGLDDMLSQVVNERVVADMSQYHGHCRLSLADDDRQRKYTVHIDPELHWSGILYLTLPEHCQGGTEFYRHIETGTDRCPIFRHEVEKYGVQTYTEAAAPIIENDSNDMSKWEHLMTVPMRFNRLVLLRPWMWHTAGVSFGDSIENGRLVQLFFLKLANA